MIQLSNVQLYILIKAVHFQAEDFSEASPSTEAVSVLEEYICLLDMLTHEAVRRNVLIPSDRDEGLKRIQKLRNRCNEMVEMLFDKYGPDSGPDEMAEAKFQKENAES